MSRTPIPLHMPDLSPFARHLAAQLQARPAPSHLELLNMLARAGGFRNYQHLRAAAAAGARMEAARPAPADEALVERALRGFDAAGRLTRWPARRQVQALCLWALWSQLPAGVSLPEREVNARLDAAHTFGDRAMLRRDLLGLGLVTRNADGSDYRRCERPPPAEARALIGRIAARRAG